MEWQPIETAPKDGTKVLLARKHKTLSNRVGVAKWKGCKWQGDATKQPTHWMPLPDPPK